MYCDFDPITLQLLKYSNKKGLHILSAPTGSGKTYSIVVAIKELIEKHKKIFFISTKKKLVEDAFKQLGDERALLLKSDEELLLDFDRFKIEIEDKVVSELFEKEIGFIRNNIGVNDEETQQLKIRKIGKIKDRIRQEIRASKDSKTYLQRHRKWLKPLFPSLYLSEFHAIFLTIDKFMAGYFAPTGTESFLSQKEMLLFIDEFDATKPRILSILLRKSQSQNIVSDFLSFHNKLWHNKAPKLAKTRKQEKKLKEFLQKVYERFHLQYPIINKTKLDRSGYILRDGEITVPYLHSKRIDICFNQREEQNEIVEHTKESGCEALLAMERSIIYHLNQSIPRFFEYAAIEYEKEKGVDSYDAQETIFNRFKLTEHEKTFIKERNLYRRLKRTNLPRDGFIDFWDRGFSVTILQDDKSHNEDTFIYYDALELTPEYIIYTLAKNNTLIGVSATATIASLIHNYNLAYLQNKLGDKYNVIEPNYELEQYLQKRGTIGKKDVSIKVEWLAETNEKNLNKLKSKLYSFLKNSQLIHFEYFLEDMLKDFETDFEKVRLLILSYLFVNFLKLKDEGRMKSFVYFGNKIKNIEKRLNVAKRIAAYIFNKDSKEFDELLLIGSAANINDLCLNERTNFFLVTAYSSLKEGVNLQHRFEKSDQIVQCGGIDTTIPLKDVDGIYLEKPTFFMDKKERMIDIANYLALYNFSLTYAPKKGLSQERLRQRKKRDIHAIFTNTAQNSIRHKKVIENFYIDYLEEYFCNEVAYLVIQAVGRINRSSYKNKEIFLFIDEFFLRPLENFSYMPAYNQALYTDEFNAIIDSIPKIAQPQQIFTFEQKVNPKNALLKREIEELLFAIFEERSPKAMRDWQTLRKIVLRYPTLTNLGEIDVNDQMFNPPNVYIDFDNELSGYSFEGEYDGVIERIAQDFSLSKRVWDKELLALMQLKELRNYFEQNHYATKWHKGRFILSPIVYNNIYKGALGEAVGDFVFSHLFDINIKEVEEENFEFFDRRYKNVYFDFKFFNEQTRFFQEEQLWKRLSEKLQLIPHAKVVIANVASNNPSIRWMDKDLNPVHSFEEARVVSIPSMIDLQRSRINPKLFSDDLRKWLHDS